MTLDFLEKGTKYEVIIYCEGKDAHREKTPPTSYTIETREVNADSTLKLRLASGGGVAISFELENG